MKTTQLKGALMLLLTALIWGLAFVAQSIGMESVGAFTFNAVRMLLGFLALLPFVIIRSKNKTAAYTNKTLKSGIVLGIIFCAASNFQQFAFYYSEAGKIAFITALYIFFVPLFGLFAKKRIKPLMWVCVFFGFVGLYFISITPGELGNINKGDILAFICAALFAIHILFIEKYTAESDGLALSCTQFAASGLLSAVLMFLFETPKVKSIASAALPLLYSGLLSCGIAYTFQIIGQKYTEATVASLIMCMESVFAVTAAAIVLHETMTLRETAGCIIMFAAIVASQLLSMRRGSEPEAAEKTLLIS